MDNSIDIIYKAILPELVNIFIIIVDSLPEAEKENLANLIDTLSPQNLINLLNTLFGIAACP